MRAPWPACPRGRENRADQGRRAEGLRPQVEARGRRYATVCSGIRGCGGRGVRISSAAPVGPRGGAALGQGREVELAERFLDQAPVVVVVERLARHLLRRGDRQVGDLLADLVDRAARLLLDVAPRLLHEVLARLLGVDLRLLLHLLAGLARAAD